MIRSNPSIDNILYQDRAPKNLNALWVCQQNNVRTLKVFNQGAWREIRGGDVNYYGEGLMTPEDKRKLDQLELDQALSIADIDAVTNF